jgi:hypothetical protein
MSIARKQTPHPELEVQDKEAASITEEKPSDASDLEQNDNADVEKNAAGTSLRREVSGPPYSVFSNSMKLWIIFLVSMSAVISPFAATTYYPALNIMSDVLHVTPTMTNISITTYMVSLPHY